MYIKQHDFGMALPRGHKKTPQFVKAEREERHRARQAVIILADPSCGSDWWLKFGRRSTTWKKYETLIRRETTQVEVRSVVNGFVILWILTYYIPKSTIIGWIVFVHMPPPPPKGKRFHFLNWFEGAGCASSPSNVGVKDGVQSGYSISYQPSAPSHLGGWNEYELTFHDHSPPKKEKERWSQWDLTRLKVG